jgi:hypothetical protein
MKGTDPNRCQCRAPKRIRCMSIRHVVVGDDEKKYMGSGDKVLESKVGEHCLTYNTCIRG